MDICLRLLKESKKGRFYSCSVRSSILIISHITFRDCHVHIFSDNHSRNSCRVFSLTWPASIQIFWNKRKRLHMKKSSTPTGLVWDTNMAAVSLFWDTNMAAGTSCENTLFCKARTRHSALKWSVEMLHKTQNFAPFNPKCWYNVKWIKITYRMFLASCSAILWRFQSLETDTPD